MNNEFEFDKDSLDFDEPAIFGEDLDDEDYEAELDLELQQINTRTAILAKNNMFALLCLKTAEKGGAICRVDPREQQPSVQFYENADDANEWFAQSLKSSLDNGWQVVYNGLPLQG